MDPDIAKFVGVMMTLVTVGLLGYGGVLLIQGLQSRLGRGHQASSLNPDEVEALRAELGEVEQLRARMVELEERVDFAERLLARSSEPIKLPGSVE